MKMPYGKHRGERICDLPTSYLKWMAETLSEKNGETEKQLCLSADEEYQSRIKDMD